MEQLSLLEWMPAACPGTEEFEAAKKKERKKNIRKKFTSKKSDAVTIKKSDNLPADQLLCLKENWYALLAAIVRDWEEDLPQYNKDGTVKKDKNGEIVWEHKAHDPNYPYYTSADDALAAMGIKRQYTLKE